LYSVDKRASDETSEESIGYAVTGGKFSSVVKADFISQAGIESDDDQRICVLDTDGKMYVIKLESDIVTNIIPAVAEEAAVKENSVTKTNAVVKDTASKVQVEGLEQVAINNAEKVADDNKKNTELKAAQAKNVDKLLEAVNGYNDDESQRFIPRLHLQAMWQRQAK
jgi:hypothetical protein